jgi:DNA (cytosine-5)-methyltransferase 1
MTYLIGSLFSGYGGLDMGVQLALGPARTAWVSDIVETDEKGVVVGNAPAILAQRYSDAPNLGDVTAVDWTSVEPVDVIAGGSPCQDLSLAGQRAGMRPGTRSGLWESMVHAIDTIRPRLVVWENVGGALSAGAYSAMESREGHLGVPADGPALRALGRVLGDLASLGYDAQWTSLRAADVGAPHARRRIFVAAYPSGEGRGGPWRTAAGEATGGRASAVDRGRGGEPLTLLPTPTAGRYGSNQSPSEGAAVRYGLDSIDKLLPTPTVGDRGGEHARGGAGFGMPLGEAVRLLPTPQVADVEGGHKRRSGARSDELLLNGIASEDRFGEYAPAIECWERVCGRPAPEPTEPGAHGSPRLSPRFVEWMMGLPDGWVTGVGITRPQQLRALGNGVVPQQAAPAIQLMLAREQELEGVAS